MAAMEKEGPGLGRADESRSGAPVMRDDAVRVSVYDPTVIAPRWYHSRGWEPPGTASSSRERKEPKEIIA